jgi:hypothetical protein
MTTSEDLHSGQFMISSLLKKKIYIISLLLQDYQNRYQFFGKVESYHSAESGPLGEKHSVI